jgi:hypothetical protein
MSEPLSTVQRNLLSVPGYSPYCGAERCLKGMPRTTWDPNIRQFVCACGWKSSFPADFITKYTKFRVDSQICSKCNRTVETNRQKYCGKGDDKDNQHHWESPKFSGIEPEYEGDIRHPSAGCWFVTRVYQNDQHHCRKPCVSGTLYCTHHQSSKRDKLKRMIGEAREFHLFLKKEFPIGEHTFFDDGQFYFHYRWKFPVGEAFYGCEFMIDYLKISEDPNDLFSFPRLKEKITRYWRNSEKRARESSTETEATQDE